MFQKINYFFTVKKSSGKKIIFFFKILKIFRNIFRQHFRQHFSTTFSATFFGDIFRQRFRQHFSNNLATFQTTLKFFRFRVRFTTNPVHNPEGGRVAGLGSRASLHMFFLRPKSRANTQYQY